MKHAFRHAALSLLLLVVGSTMHAQSKAEAAKAKLADGPGKETTARICSACHSVEVSVSRRESREGWNAIVLNMLERGAKGSDEEFGEIVEYLTAHYSPNSPPVSSSASSAKVNVNTAAAADLQSGLGITPDEAIAVVHYREEKGKFTSFEDLGKVPGLSLSKLDSKKSAIVF